MSKKLSDIINFYQQNDIDEIYLEKSINRFTEKNIKIDKKSTISKNKSSEKNIDKSINKSSPEPKNISNVKLAKIEHKDFENDSKNNSEKTDIIDNLNNKFVPLKEIIASAELLAKSAKNLADLKNIIENNEKYNNDLYDRFNIKTFDSYGDIIQKFTTFLDYNDINVHKKKENTISKVDVNVIKKLISSKYTISTNEMYKIKSLTLIEEVMNLLKINNFFKIFNRWGQLVFETTDEKKRWDGTVKGVKQPNETYVWIGEGVDMRGNKILKRGEFILLR